MQGGGLVTTLSVASAPVAASVCKVDGEVFMHIDYKHPGQQARGLKASWRDCLVRADDGAFGVEDVDGGASRA